MAGQVVRVDALRSLVAGSVSGTYVAIGSKFTHPMRLLKIVNNTNADLTISFDSANDNDFVPAGGFTLYDCTTNKNLPDSTFVFQNGTSVYVRAAGTLPSTGSVYVVVIFGQGD